MMPRGGIFLVFCDAFDVIEIRCKSFELSAMDVSYSFSTLCIDSFESGCQNTSENRNKFKVKILNFFTVERLWNRGLEFDVLDGVKKFFPPSLSLDQCHCLVASTTLGGGQNSGR